MPELEPDKPEYEATANLSPVSPSPVHGAPQVAVPALQETVDTIDAIVEAAASPSGQALLEKMVQATESTAAHAAEEEFVDNDSFSDAYDDDTHDASTAPVQVQETEDDYAKTFDSPIEPETDDGVNGTEKQDAEPAKHTDAKQQPLPSPQASEAPSSVKPAANHDMNLASTSKTADNSNPIAAEPTSVPESVPAKPPMPQQPANPELQNAASSDIQPSSSNQQAQFSAMDADPTASPNAFQTESSTPSASLAQVFPSAASLPKRPPVPETAAHSFPSQHHPSGSNNAAVPAVNTPGSMYAGHASRPDSMASIAAFAQPGHNIPLAGVPTQSAPALYNSQAAGYLVHQSNKTNYENSWEQFLSDERQYLLDAKWDRFPEGSRIFIGMHHIVLFQVHSLS